LRCHARETLGDEGYEEILTEHFPESYEKDFDRNPVDFIYWYNSSGMSEFSSERAEQGLTIRQFLKKKQVEADNKLKNAPAFTGAFVIPAKAESFLGYPCRLRSPLSRG